MGGLIPGPDWKIGQLVDQLNKVQAELNELRRRIDAIDKKKATN